MELDGLQSHHQARQQEKSEHYIKVLNEHATTKIITKVLPLDTFYKAEDYHKNYFKNHPDATYCQLVITPKVEKVEQKFKSLLK